MGHIVKPSSGKVIFGAGGVPAALLNPTGEGEHTFSDESSPLQLPRHPRKMLPSLLDPTSLATCSPNAPPRILIWWSFFGISFKRSPTQVAKYSRSGLALGILYRLLPETGVFAESETEAEVAKAGAEAWAEARSLALRQTPR